MRITPARIPDVKIIDLDRHGDTRGYFMETYDTRSFAEIGINTKFVLDACSRNQFTGTVRALHFQIGNAAQAKLARVTRGRVLDVVVDIRAGSPSFGEHVAIEMDENDAMILFIPVGFAHGFCTMAPDTEMAYKLSSHFSPGDARAILWNDPDLKINWPVSPEEATLSEKDRDAPRFRDCPAFFDYHALRKAGDVA
jgi:dTDP-4-dehydrorhamnose 3,5-epimerase